MSEFDTVDKDIMICPYCGLERPILIGAKYEICGRCDKPFEISLKMTKMNEHWPHEYTITTKTIQGVE